MRHRRFLYAVAALATIALGLLWRSGAIPLPAWAAKYGGDALWALMVYWAARFLFPLPAIAWRCALGALSFSFAIEFSQLCHAPWLDGIRATRLGALALGSVFNWPDFSAYTLGILIGWLADFSFSRILRLRGPQT